MLNYQDFKNHRAERKHIRNVLRDNRRDFT
jgi:hypothetical protein